MKDLHALRPLADRDGVLELSYGLTPEAWGRGYATEAAAALVGRGFAELELAALLGMARPANCASHRVLEKLGFVYVELSDRYYQPAVAVYRLERARWAGVPQSLGPAFAALAPLL